MNYSTHKKRWSGCTDCNLCEVRRKVVLARGQINPCDVLFIGEAPGEVEDIRGKPFVGPAGMLLDDIIEGARFEERGLRWAFTNLVACIPKDSKGGKKITEPDKVSIKSCQERLCEFVKLAKPKAIVRVGKLVTKYVQNQSGFSDVNGIDGLVSWTPTGKIKFVDIVHPAAILRAGPQDTLMVKRCVVTLQELGRELVNAS